ncbi:MAG: LysM peptidoglycan-binding domain-containing protein [Desulfosalsimonadaceae bacterium]
MTEKNRRIAPAGAFPLPRHPFWFLLTVVCLITCASPCRALSANMDVPASGNADYCKPAGISLHDKSIRAGLLYDVSADSVVWEKNGNQALPIASLTKMMVALITVEDIFDGKVSLDTTVKVTPESAKMNGSKVYLRTGCCLSVEELLKAALISSGNDAAYLLAQFLGGTESAFVKRMNKRAAQLGMKNTFYSNSTGMPAKDSRNDNHSSPSDLLILSLEMLKYKDLLEIAGMSKAVITQDKRTINLRNHNGLVATYDDVDGFKTGFTLNAKYCLVATANKGGRRLISIVLGASGRNVRNQFTATAISRYYEALGMGGLEPKSGFAVAKCVSKPPVSHIAKKETAVAAAGTGAGRFHQVKRGDTLFKIANRYGCEIAELKAWNRIRGNRIDPGMKLTIHQAHSGKESGKSPVRKSSVRVAKKAGPEKNSGSRTVHMYTVRRGDTLWKIAQKFDGITVNDIMKANRIRRAKALKPGTTLKIVMDA